MLPASYSEFLEQERISVFFTVPFALIQLLLRGALEQRDWSALRWILFGGEPFPPQHLRALMQRWPRIRFSNIYGPAEVNGVTRYHVPVSAVQGDSPIPIGTLCPNVEGRIINKSGRPAKPGEAGELLIRSATMMQGYWNRPDLNQEAFVVEEVFPAYRKTFFRTGDLVRRRNDGELEFLGRLDRQIKTRGFRVELDEVEAVIAAHPGVEGAAVYGVPDGQGSLRIEGSVILRDPESLAGRDLVQHARERLPPYAVPVDIRIETAFPRTTSGKIDRRELARRAAEEESLSTP